MGLEKLVHVDPNKYSVAERLRMSFEELGPTFVKLGQLLASRPDLIPIEYTEEFKKLHDQVRSVPFSEVETTLIQNFGSNWRENFSEFDENPIGAASIAQVHLAKLTSGEQVVVKIQRPGINNIIEEDLSILYTLAELLEKYIDELKLYNLLGIVDEFAKALELETNFVIEANNIRRFQDNFHGEPSIKIPQVYGELSGRKVLVMEALRGISLSQKNALDQEGINPEEVLRTGLRCYLKMVFTDGLFHGDLHAGNMFVLPNNKVGLIDFGVIGRLNKKTQASIANMLVALATEDYDRLAYEYVDLAPFAEGVDVDLFARDLRDLIAPYYGLTLKHVNVGKLLLESASLAASYRLKLPGELIMFFKSIITIEGMGRVIVKDFNFLAYSLEFAAELVESKTEPKKIMRELSSVGRDVNALLSDMPRQVRQLLRRLMSPDFAIKVELVELKKLRKTQKNSANLVFLGFIIAALLIGAAMLMDAQIGPTVLGMPVLAATHYGVALALGFVAFVNYIRR